MGIVNWSNRPALSWLRRSDETKPRINIGDTWRRLDNGNGDSLSQRGLLFLLSERHTVAAGDDYYISFAPPAGKQLRVISRTVDVSAGNWDIQVIEGATYSGGSPANINCLNRAGGAHSSTILTGATFSSGGTTIIEGAAFGGNTGQGRGVTNNSGSGYIFDPEGEALFKIRNTDPNDPHDAIINIVFAEIPEDEL